MPLEYFYAVSMDLAEADDTTKNNPGGLFVLNTPPRKKITINVSETSSSTSSSSTTSGNITLSSNSTKIKVYDANTGGNQISLPKTWPGQGTTWPMDLWVEGVGASATRRDITLTVVSTKPPPPPARGTDTVKFTVLWVTISLRAGNTDALSGDMAVDALTPAQTLTAFQVFTSRDKLGQFANNNPNPPNDPRIGVAVELKGTVQPSDFVPGEFGVVLKQKRSFLANAVWEDFNQNPIVKQQGTDDTSADALQDVDPQSNQSGGKIYDLDMPSQNFPTTAPIGKLFRWRVNFKQWADVSGTKCSSDFLWYVRFSASKNTPGLQFLTDYQGDNQIATGTTPTTRNLQ